MLYRALVCDPPDTVNKGLRKKDLGEVNVPEAKEEHRLYKEEGLRDFLGFGLVEMVPDNKFPDCVFVEDPAVIIRDLVVVARMCDEKRRGEEDRLREALRPFFAREFLCIEEPGFLEGGDVLITDRMLYVGISDRTNVSGAYQLAKIAWDNFRLPLEAFDIPKTFLHLKGEVTYHRSPDGGALIVSEQIADHFTNSGHRLIVTPQEERFGGNCISNGRRILVHANRPKSRKILELNGFLPMAVNLSQYPLIDGAMSCLSKIF